VPTYRAFAEADLPCGRGAETWQLFYCLKIYRVRVVRGVPALLQRCIRAPPTPIKRIIVYEFSDGKTRVGNERPDREQDMLNRGMFSDVIVGQRSAKLRPLKG